MKSGAGSGKITAGEKEAEHTEYKRLTFREYFINTSEDYTHTGELTRHIRYAAFKYYSSRLQRAIGLAHEVNYDVHYEEDRDVIQLNFQRTLDKSDWVANVFEFSSKYYAAIEFKGRPLQLRVHHGWGNMYKAIKYTVRKRWQRIHEKHPHAHTEVLGWSLGAGIACLCAQDLNYNFGIKPYLYTFGSVRPFKAAHRDTERLREYLDTVCTECLNFSDVNDLISYMPPFRGFMMINRVDVGLTMKKSFFKLMHPLKYHIHYDTPALYENIERTTRSAVYSPRTGSVPAKNKVKSYEHTEN